MLLHQKVLVQEATQSGERKLLIKLLMPYGTKPWEKMEKKVFINNVDS